MRKDELFVGKPSILKRHCGCTDAVTYLRHSLVQTFFAILASLGPRGALEHDGVRLRCVAM